MLRLSPASGASLLVVFPLFVSPAMLEHRARTRSLFRRPCARAECASAGAAKKKKKKDESRRRSLLRSSSLPGTGRGGKPRSCSAGCSFSQKSFNDRARGEKQSTRERVTFLLASSPLIFSFLAASALRLEVTLALPAAPDLVLWPLEIPPAFTRLIN